MWTLPPVASTSRNIHVLSQKYAKPTVVANSRSPAGTREEPDELVLCENPTKTLIIRTCIDGIEFLAT